MSYFRVTMIDFARAEVLSLNLRDAMPGVPRLPTKQQDVKRLDGLVALNKLVAKAERTLVPPELRPTAKGPDLDLRPRLARKRVA